MSKENIKTAPVYPKYGGALDWNHQPAIVHWFQLSVVSSPIAPPNNDRKLVRSYYIVVKNSSHVQNHFLELIQLYMRNLPIYFWVNYNNSLTWIKAIWGWFPLLTMIIVRSQWGRYNLPRLSYLTYFKFTKDSSNPLEVDQSSTKVPPWVLLAVSTLQVSGGHHLTDTEDPAKWGHHGHGFTQWLLFDTVFNMF